jgi:acetyltransferase-like isoleucine patch superfamily enzyme
VIGASIFGAEHTSIGRDTRIDRFAVITAGSLLGTARITIGEPGVVAAGIPARTIGTRDLAELEQLERRLRSERRQS